MAPYRIALWAVSLLSALMLTACEQATVGRQPPTTITIAGATAMRPVLLELTEAYAETHPNVFFDLRRGGSTLGEEWVREGRVDIAASTLLASPDDAAATGTREDLARVPIGVDGIAVILHPSNPIDALTLLELRELYLGNIIDWSALGGSAESVRLVSREDGSGTRRLFEERVMAGEPVSLTSIVMPTSRAVVDHVAEHAGAVGYVTRAYVVELLGPQPRDAAPNVKVVPVDGQLPTLEALRDQAYALPQPLYLVTRPDPSSAVRQFLDFALSPAGQEIVGRYHLPVR